MKYLVANWKANKNITEAKEWLQRITNYELGIKDLKVILAAAFIHLPSIKEFLDQDQQRGFHLASQDLSLFPSGAYTGEISAEMLKGLVDYAIVGHSERRQYFGETNEIVAKKIKQALDQQITPIICVDEPYLESQIKTMEQWNNGTMEQFIFAYEPLAAIGTAKPDTPENANQVAKRIKDLTKKEASVLYGGSVTDKNVKAFVDQENINGVLIGGASLKVEEFRKIIKAWK